MAAKSKSNTNNITLLTSLLGTVIVGLLASPVIVEYVKKSRGPEATPAAATTSAAPATAPASAPANAAASEPAVVDEQCLKKAWDAFNARRYESAMQFAEQCIDNFGKAADRAQEKLDSENEPLPPEKPNAVEKDKILKRGLLNDVAAAYFIKGRSAEYLYKAKGPKAAEYKSMAEEAYKATCRYKHARVWDTRGWFWSPCEAANGRLPLK
ncbi:MAG TPA: hypothetical protein VJS44_14125 [Pyrinomonadaceae bacterium]|nr:hypothetical protein [Pyrinomonadaceae bacterium]